MPLTRFTTMDREVLDASEPDHNLIRAIPAFSKICRWNGIVTDVLYSTTDLLRPSAFLAFCRAVCHLFLDDVTLSMKCHNCLAPEDEDGYTQFPPFLAHSDQPGDKSRYLEPVRLLRNVKTLKFWCSVCLGGLSDDLFSEDEIVTFKSLAESSSPIDHVFEQYDRPLDYARSFERWQPFREGMGFPYVSSIDPQLHPDYSNPYQHCGPHPIEKVWLLHGKLAMPATLATSNSSMLNANSFLIALSLITSASQSSWTSLSNTSRPRKSPVAQSAILRSMGPLIEIPR